MTITTPIVITISITTTDIMTIKRKPYNCLLTETIKDLMGDVNR